MSADVDRLFVALHGEPASRVPARLNELCDDEQTRQQVLELLSADREAQAEHWLESAPVSLGSAWTGCGETTSDAGVSSQQEPVETRSRAVTPPRIGRYVTSAYLGGGGFADVFLAHDPHLDIPVAVKLARRPVENEQERSQFLREAQHLIRLNHPHIVRVYNADVTEQGQPYIVMEHVDGTTLREYADRHPRLSLEEVARIMQPVCEAMAYAHQSNLVHRDLKPANILIGADGLPKVTDFGLAVRDDLPNAFGEYAGTTAYMAPEQVRSESDDLHGSTDIWALGVILYELLTGRRPFHGSRLELHDAILSKSPKRLREIRDEIPQEVEAICIRCLAKDPADRPGSARDIARALSSASSPADPVQRVGGRNWKRVAASIMAACGVFVATALAVVNRDRDDDRVTIEQQPDVRGEDLAWTHPTELVWNPYDDQVDSRGYDPSRRVFEFDTHDVSLFQAGTCQGDVLTLQTRFRIEDNERVGQGGVYWAWGPVTGDPRIGSCCWAIQLGRAHVGGPFVLEIKQHNLGPSGGRLRVLDKNPVIMPVEIVEPRTPVFDLEARVTAREVTQILVNGEAVLDLPVPLEAVLGRRWDKLKGTGFGLLGYHGTFAVEAFSAE